MKSTANLRMTIDRFFAEDAGLERLMVALGRRTAAGTPQSGSKAAAVSWNDDLEVQTRPDIIAALKTTLRKAVAEIGIDPNQAGIAVMAVRHRGAIHVQIAAVLLGSIEAGQYVSFMSCTDAEWEAIANGPKPHLFPYRKMAQPIGAVVDITPDGTVGRRTDEIPGKREWNPVPIPWNALTAIETSIKANLAEAIAIAVPSVAQIRRCGEEDGLR